MIHQSPRGNLSNWSSTSALREQSARRHRRCDGQFSWHRRSRRSLCGLVVGTQALGKKEPPRSGNGGRQRPGPENRRRRGARVGRRSEGSRWGVPVRHRVGPSICVARVQASLISARDSKSVVHVSELGSSQAATSCWVPGAGKASLEAAKRTRREMARSELRWSDEEILSQFGIDVARCSMGGGC